MVLYHAISSYQLLEVMLHRMKYHADEGAVLILPDFIVKKYPQYQKTTNKRGGTAEVSGEIVSVFVRTDNNDFEKVNDFENTKGYIVYRIKKKKWKKIQMKFSSTKPFGLKSYTLESFVGGYIKR